jgi:hypothetical protein
MQPYQSRAPVFVPSLHNPSHNQPYHQLLPYHGADPYGAAAGGGGTAPAGSPAAGTAAGTAAVSTLLRLGAASRAVSALQHEALTAVRETDAALAAAMARSDDLGGRLERADAARQQLRDRIRGVTKQARAIVAAEQEQKYELR